MERIQLGGNYLGLFRVPCRCVPEGFFQDACITSLPYLFLILPVINTLIIGKEDVHIRRIFRKGISSCGMFVKGMGNALALAYFVLSFIKACQKQNQKRHVIGYRNLALYTVSLLKLPAEAAVIGLI